MPEAQLVATLSASNTDVTVFAPTDEAFAILAADLGYTGSPTDEAAITTFLVENVPVETLQTILLYHVSPEGKTLSEVAALDEVETLSGVTISPDGITLTDAEPDLINPTLVATDIIASNGVIHVIDRVLLPVDLDGNTAPTITGLVAASGEFDNNGSDFDLLLNAVVAAGLAGALDDPNADLTVFAPNDDAFMATAAALGYTGSSEQGAFTYIVDALTLLSGGGDPIPLLTDILLYHVAPESLQSGQVLSADSIATLLGADLTVDGASLVDAEPDLPDPSIIAVDIQAANGVVHVIDGVLVPADLLQSDGSNDVDFIIAGNTADTISTGQDNDYVSAKGGSDHVSGGSDNDVILGGSGRDTVAGDAGNDLLVGDNGADSMAGGNDRDMADGGSGSDTMDGGAGADTLDGGAGKDSLTGGTGADTFVFAIEGNGADVITDFGVGKDVIDMSQFGFASFDDLIAGATITEADGATTISFGKGESMTLLGVEAADLNAADFLL